mmetsp:Transcript_40679/g.76142  ORF Transcript_40679/g.76142 Transcript_40679/m.76142 type:complete len:88 (+) Transcript_40679:1812-2075(+)
MDTGNLGRRRPETTLTILSDEHLRRLPRRFATADAEHGLLVPHQAEEVEMVKVVEMGSEEVEAEYTHKVECTHPPTTLYGRPDRGRR